MSGLIIIVDDCWEYFSNTYTEIMKACIPTYQPRTRKIMYITCEAIHLKNVNNRLWKRYTASNLPSDHKASVMPEMFCKVAQENWGRFFQENCYNKIKYNLCCADYDSIQWTIFYVRCIDWSNQMSGLSVDDCWEYFQIHNYTEIMEACIPTYKPHTWKNMYMNMADHLLSSKQLLILYISLYS